MCEVRVQALDPIGPSAGGRDVAQRIALVAPAPIAFQRGGEAVPPGRVAPEPIGQRAHEALGLEAAGPLHQQRAGEPEARGEGRAVLEPGVALDHHRHAEMTAPDDRPLAAQRATELSLHDTVVLGGMKEFGDHDRMVVTQPGIALPLLRRPRARRSTRDVPMIGRRLEGAQGLVPEVVGRANTSRSSQLTPTNFSARSKKLAGAVGPERAARARRRSRRSVARRLGGRTTKDLSPRRTRPKARASCSR